MTASAQFLVAPSRTDSPTRASLRRTRGGSRSGTALIWVGSAIAAAVVIVAIAFQLGGGRWFIVETPSMGTAAPVGSLILDTRISASALRVGDIVTFHPPTAPSESYTHRIISLTGRGTSLQIHTRGDINGATDPWTLGHSDIIGRAGVIVPVIGWGIRAFPIVAVGVVLVLLLTRLIHSRTWRSAYRISGFSFTVALAAFILRPFASMVVLQTTVAHHSASATVVSTGILPIRVSATGGTHATLASGEVGHILIPSLVRNGHYSLAAALNLSFTDWIVFIAICCIPLFWSLLVGLPADRETEDRRADRRGARSEPGNP